MTLASTALSLTDSVSQYASEPALVLQVRVRVGARVGGSVWLGPRATVWVRARGRTRVRGRGRVSKPASILQAWAASWRAPRFSS